VSGAAAKTVSVIVLTWNGLEVTRKCLASLLENTTHADFEVVVVDNGSTDGTVEYLRGLAGIRLIENGENLGFVRGNNKGIEATATDVVLLNNDTEIGQGDWLEKMQELAYQADDIGVVGCRLVNAEGNLVHAGTYMPVPSFWGQEYPGNELDIGQYTRDRRVEGVIAACVYIKRAVIDEVGALDTDYFSYYEDTDFCLKAERAGFQTWCCGGATVMHVENASTDVNRMDFSGTFKRSREVFLSKWKGFYQERYAHRLTWHSFISGQGLYSSASAKILWALDRAGVDVNLAFLEGVERAELDDFRINDMKNRWKDRKRPQVLFGPPDMLERADGSYNIGYVFTPYDRFEPSWVKELNRLDEVWVTSHFQKEAAHASGVKREVFVMPLGVDPDYFHPGIKSFPLPGRFAFIAPVEWGDAYASETLLRAYTDEFTAGDKVVLIMKATSPVSEGPDSGGWAAEAAVAGGSAEVEEAVEAMSLPLDRAPVVFVVDHEIDPYQAGSMYRSADCVVLVNRASEPGAAALEALACGVPLVALDWGTTAGLIDGVRAVGVESVLAPSPVAGLQWADPYYGKMREALRKVYANSEAARAQALSTSEGLRTERSWDETAARMIERLDVIAGR
jgi:GT2 family glycosyltransferase/glycosyltransferase involved in cell wall biosynthesis